MIINNWSEMPKELLDKGAGQNIYNGKCIGANVPNEAGECDVLNFPFEWEA